MTGAADHQPGPVDRRTRNLFALALVIVVVATRRRVVLLGGQPA